MAETSKVTDSCIPAASGEEAFERLDADVDVVLLDRLMPGLSGEQVLERIRESGVDCRVGMVTAVEPDSDVATMPFDAYVPKALDRETVVETVDRLAARADYDAVLREHYAVAEKLSTIEAREPEPELAKDDAYRELVDRFRELEARLSARGDDLDRDQVVGSVEAVAGGETATDEPEQMGDDNE